MAAYLTHIAAFEEANAQVLGISVDSFASVGEFQEKLGLEFPLLSDFPNHEAGKAYGVFMEENGINGRVSFVIDKDRVIRDVYEEMRDPASHPTHVLEVLKNL